jgi:hypothetical protein
MLRSVGGPWARVLVAVSAFLLLSMGGAIVAAPLTLPLLYLAVRGDRIGAGLRTAAVVIAALTVAEVAWAATYLAVAEAKPWIWLLPVAAGAAAASAFGRSRSGPGSPRPDATTALPGSAVGPQIASCRSQGTGGREDRPRLGNDIVTS